MVPSTPKGRRRSDASPDDGDDYTLGFFGESKWPPQSRAGPARVSCSELCFDGSALYQDKKIKRDTPSSDLLSWKIVDVLADERHAIENSL